MEHLMKHCIALYIAVGILAGKAQGQTIKVQVKDPSIQKNTQFIVMKTGEKAKSTAVPFDKKGRYTYGDTAFQAGGRYFISFGGALIQLRLKKGEETTLEAFPAKDGKGVLCTYKGYAAEAYALRDSMREAFRYSRYFSRKGDNAETLRNYAEKLRTLDAYHQNLTKLAEGIKDKSIADELKKSIECEWIRYRLALMRVKDRKEGISRLKDSEFQNILERIDLNDPVYDSYGLVDEYIKGKVEADMYANPIEFGNGFVKETCARIKNPKMRRKLLTTIATYMTMMVSGDDIDRFWIPFKQNADPDIVKAFEPKILSMKKTKKGTPAPDSEFTDAQGKVHKFSDYRGKLLYVDLWATWCGPCKKEIPHLAKLVERFKGNPKVAFISISTDTNRAAWLSMITKDKPQWPQYIVLKEQVKKINEAWGINAIPRFIMINPDGTINSAEATRPSDPKTAQLIEQLTK